MLDTEELKKEIRGNVGTIKFNRPERKNALSPDMLLDLHLTLKKWEKNSDVRAVVITGNSETGFSSGYDISSIPTDLTLKKAKILKDTNPLELALNSIKHHPCAVIAMINGYCFGAALNLAMCCDIRIGADQVQMGMPPARLGLVYHPEGLMQFIEIIGIARVRELFLTARTYKGREALEMGLVDHMVEGRNLVKTTYDYAEAIAANAPLAVRGTKKIINMLGPSLRLSESHRREAEEITLQAFNSLDLKEGQTAFLEKRKPVFSGR